MQVSRKMSNVVKPWNVMSTKFNDITVLSQTRAKKKILCLGQRSEKLKVGSAVFFGYFLELKPQL